MLVDALERDRMNIKSLVLDRPGSQDLDFDPQRDITQTDFERARNFNVLGLLDSAFNLHILFPERIGQVVGAKGREVERLGTQRLESRLEYIKNQQNRYELGFESNHLMFSGTALALKLFFPRQPQDVYLNEARHLLKANVERYREQKLWVGYMAQIRDLKMLYSNPTYDFDIEAPWPWIKDELQACQNDPEKVERFSSLASLVRLCFPDKFPEIEIDARTWQRMKRRLEEVRGREDSGSTLFYTLAAEMMILVAKEVHVTDQGIELEMPDLKLALTEPMPPIPNTRRF